MSLSVIFEENDMLIPLKEYAEKLGKNPDNARQLAWRGSFQTAQKIGRDWFVEDIEPWPDRRVKSGAYIGFRRRTSNEKSGNS